MIIPDKDCIENHKIVQYRVSADVALEYQCKKNLYLIREIDKHLMAAKSSPRHYIESKEFHYYLDFLFSSFSTMVEYYYSWVIFSYVGSYKPNKVWYRGVSQGTDEFDDLIKKLLKQHLVGRLPPERLDEAKTLLVNALSKISGRWVKEFLTINNYLKHNSMVQTYAPKFDCRNRSYNYVFFYVYDFSKDHVNDSIFKKLLLSELDDSSNGTLNKDIFEVEVFLKIGGLNICEV